MNPICDLENPVQQYPWGSRSAIAELLGKPSPSPAPEAELWMGAHPKAPSIIPTAEGAAIPLDAAIAEHPEAFLGQAAAARFNSRLPYLFKVLAAEKPLSIQAHPNLQQARDGYARENEKRIPLDAPNRNYKDDNHKPECICALTDFWALCGFREISAILSLFERLDVPGLTALTAPLHKQPSPDGLKNFFSNLMMLKPDVRAPLLSAAMVAAAALGDTDPIFQWMHALGQAYANDIGMLSPIILNLVRLAPGDALYLPAGELHAYLDGVGIELMANSDNVLRGGLTPKHIDIPELLHVLNFTPKTLSVLRPRPSGKAEFTYETPTEEFRLSILRPEPGVRYESPKLHSAEILLCTEGRAEIQSAAETGRPLKKGNAVLITASAGPYAVSGKAVIYKAAVPLS